MSSIPGFDYESRFWEGGIELVAGIDEAGMGALAGPVVASAVIFDRRSKTPIPNDQYPMKTIVIRDSKKMSARAGQPRRRGKSRNSSSLYVVI